jgi:hypothetical protein
VYFDALVIFDPFGFDVGLGGGLELLLDDDVVAGLYFDLSLSGPNPFRIRGHVWVKVLRVKVSFRIRHEWGQERSIPPSIVDPVAVLRRAIRQRGAFEPLAPRNRMRAVTIGSDRGGSGAVDPWGGVRFVQKAVPLSVRFDRVGESLLTGSIRRLDLTVFSPEGDHIEVQVVRREFVRGQFWSLSDDEKLRAPAFDRHVAGFDIASAELEMDAGRSVACLYEHEYIELPVEEHRRAVSSILSVLPLADTLVARWADANYAEVAEPEERFHTPHDPGDPVILRELGFSDGPMAPRDVATPASRIGELVEHARGNRPAVSVEEIRETWMSDGAPAAMDSGINREANPLVAEYLAVGIG